METAVTTPSSTPAIALSRTAASAAFVLLIVGITYFGILVIKVRYGDPSERAAAFVELGDFLAGRAPWFQDGRTYGAAALVLALVSILFGVHPLARITLPIAGASFLILQVWGDELRELIVFWARNEGERVSAAGLVLLSVRLAGATRRRTRRSGRRPRARPAYGSGSSRARPTP